MSFLRPGGGVRLVLGRQRAYLSAPLLDADEVTRRIPEGAVAKPIVLGHRLLDDLGAAGLNPFERPVEVLCSPENPTVRSFGHHLGDGAAFVVRSAGIDDRQLRSGWGGGWFTSIPPPRSTSTRRYSTASRSTGPARAGGSEASNSAMYAVWPILIDLVTASGDVYLFARACELEKLEAA